MKKLVLSAGIALAAIALNAQKLTTPFFFPAALVSSLSAAATWFKRSVVGMETRSTCAHLLLGSVLFKNSSMFV